MIKAQHVWRIDSYNDRIGGAKDGFDRGVNSDYGSSAGCLAKRSTVSFITDRATFEELGI